MLSLCEAAAAAEGFSGLELVATLSGGPLHGAYGFTPKERIEVFVGAVAVPPFGWRSRSRCVDEKMGPPLATITG